MTNENQLVRKIQFLKEKIVGVGEMYPGAVSQQYNICGTVGCKCKDKKAPVKHGPYSNLSFTFKGKSRTKFIRKELEADFARYTANYKEFRDHIEQLVQCNMELIDLRSKRQ